MEQLKKDIPDNKTSTLGQLAIKAGVWYTISSICVKCVSVVTMPIFTRIMSTADYGIVSNFTSWHSLLIVFCTMNLSYSIGRAKLDFPGKLPEYIYSMQMLSAIITALICVSMLLGGKIFSGWAAMPQEIVFLLTLFLFFYPSVQFAQNAYRYQYKYKQNIAITAYTTISTIFLSMALVLLMPKQRYIGRILGMVLPTVLLSFYFWFISIKKMGKEIHIEFWTYGLALAGPLVIHTVSLSILGQSDRILITKFCGADSTGIYSLAYQYANLINVVTGAISEAWLPWFHDSYASGQYQSIRKNVTPILIIGCFIGLVSILAGPEAIRFLGGDAYKEGYWVIPPISLGIICSYIYTHYVNVELHLKKTKYVSIATIIAAVTNIILNIVFIPRFGFIAAGYTTFFSYIVLMLIHYFVVNNILKVTLYNNKLIFSCLIFSSLFVSAT